MPGTPPTSASFISIPNTTLTVIPSRDNKPPANILLLLHALGDTHASLATLSQNLNLPETTSISLRGPSTLPEEIFGIADAYHWSDNTSILSNTTSLLSSSSSSSAAADGGGGRGGFDNVAVNHGVAHVDKIVNRLLEMGWKEREIVIFGCGMGGAVALQFICQNGRQKKEFGGVVSIGGVLSSTFKKKGSEEESDEKALTPVILLGGNANSVLSSSAERNVKEAIKNVEVERWARSGDGMMRNREEVLPLMKFFGRRLRSRVGVPKDAVEV